MTFTNSLPAALSPSRLQDFQSCPRKYQHASVDRIPQPATYATAKGNLAHLVFEQLFNEPANLRTAQRASEFVAGAEAKIITETVRLEIGLDETGLARLRTEMAAMITSYFTIEDPQKISCEGVELRINHEVDGVPMLGILDRLDRDDGGALTIVDYKTGSLPNRNFDTQTFANAELYAALCESALGERPRSIRLLYVSHGEAVERPVTAPVVLARKRSAADAWRRITQLYEEGNFPATPSRSACRFCAYKDLCRSNGVAVVS